MLYDISFQKGSSLEDPIQQVFILYQQVHLLAQTLYSDLDLVTNNCT